MKGLAPIRLKWLGSVPMMPVEAHERWGFKKNYKVNADQNNINRGTALLDYKQDTCNISNFAESLVLQIIEGTNTDTQTHTQTRDSCHYE